MRSRKGSLEIGVNTIVILVIAMVLLGLGIGFIKGMFTQMSTLKSGIKLPSNMQQPTSEDPFILENNEISLKSGESKPERMVAAIYNKWGAGAANFTLNITSCAGPSPSFKPNVTVLPQLIDKGEYLAFEIDVAAISTTSDGSYVCNLGAFMQESAGTYAQKSNIQLHIRITS